MKIKNWCLFALLFMCEYVFAQSNSWTPNKPVRLIVPQVAGGGADAIGRTIGQALSEKIGQPVIVDNRPGTNGGVGMDVLLNAPADGYNLILVFTSMMAINPAVYEKINYDPLRDLKALGAVFKGEGPAVAHVLSGQDSIIYVGTPAIILSQVQSGKLKALGVTTAKRMSQIPNIPTLAESGIPDFNESFWYGLAASSNTPQYIVDAYNKVVNDIAKSDNLQNNLGKMGCNPLPLTSQEFTEKVRNDIKKYSSLAKSVNMKVD